MKIKQQVLVLCLLITVFSVSNCGQLSKEENEFRLIRCGRQHLKTFPTAAEMDFPKNEWLVKVVLVDSQQSISDFSLGSFISPRHIITSSQPIVNDDKQWFWGTTPIQEYINGTENAQVPLDKISKGKLAVTRNPAAGLSDSNLLTVKSAWVLHVKSQDDVRERRSPMLIELEENVEKLNYACLADRFTPDHSFETVHLYGFSEASGLFLGYRNRSKYVVVDGKWAAVDNYKAKKDRGGPMVQRIDDMTTIIGIGASPPVDDKTESIFFFHLPHFSKDLCSLAGICEVTPEYIVTTWPPRPTFPINNTFATRALKTTTTTRESQMTRRTTPPPEIFFFDWGDDVFNGVSRGGWGLGALLVLMWA